MNERGCEQLTWFPGDSLASRFPSPGSDAAREMTVTSGMKCCGLLTKSGPLGSLARMLLASSAWHSRSVNLLWRAEQLPATRIRTTTRRYCHDRRKCCSSASSKTSVRSVTMSSHLLFRLAVSAPRTEGTGSPLLPTVTATLGEHGGPNQRDSSGRPGLQMAAEMWPTPRAKEDGAYQYSKGDKTKPVPTLSGAVKLWPTPVVPNGGRSVKSVTDWRSERTAYQNDRKVQVDLNAAVGMWPTPRSNAGTGPCKHGEGGPDLQSTVMWSTPAAQDAKNSTFPESQGKRDTLIGDLMRSEKTSDGQLNPAWVTRLMGFPDGWLDL